MSKVYIAAAKRTAIGSFLGTLKNEKPTDMGATVLKHIIDETKVDKAKIDEVIIGNVLSAGLGQGVGRQVAIKAGLSEEIPGYSLNMVCGSGMKTIMNGFTGIKAGLSNLVVTGGIENMSSAPYLISGKIRSGYKMGNMDMTDHMLYDALTDSYQDYHMGITAENISRKYDITREMQDEFATASQQKAVKAIKEGKFADEIVPYEIKTRRGVQVFDTDEYPRKRTTVETLAKLRTAFEKGGTVTAGNSSGVNDGAAVIIVASEEAVKEQNLTPFAEIVAVGQGGVDPSFMGLAQYLLLSMR